MPTNSPFLSASTYQSCTYLVAPDSHWAFVLNSFSQLRASASIELAHHLEQSLATVFPDLSLRHSSHSLETLFPSLTLRHQNNLGAAVTKSRTPSNCDGTLPATSLTFFDLSTKTPIPQKGVGETGCSPFMKTGTTYLTCGNFRTQAFAAMAASARPAFVRFHRSSAAKQS